MQLRGMKSSEKLSNSWALRLIHSATGSQES